MATDVEILARLITNQVLTIDAGAGRNIGDLTNNDASGSIYNSWLKICEPLVPWINTHGSGSSGSGSLWGLISGNIEDQTDLYNELTTLSGSIVNRELLSNKSTDINLGTSNILYPTQNAVKTYVDTNISASSSITTASNVGLGEGEVYKEKVGNDLRFKTIKAGTNITISNDTNEITINSTASGSSSSGSIPSGGDINQVLTKSGVEDYSASWRYPPGMFIYGNKTDLTINGSESINNYFNINLATSSVFSLVGLSTKNPYTFLINNTGFEEIVIDYPQEYVVDLAPADTITVSTGSSKEATVIYDGIKRIWRIGDELHEVPKYEGIPLYIGGNFTTSLNSRLAVVDKITKASGSGWPVFNSTVNVVIQDSVNVYVGGQFTSPGSKFAVIDKTTKATGSGWPSFDNFIYTTLVDSNNIYVGGSFTNKFAVIDKTTKATGSGWPSFNNTVFFIG